VPKYRSHGQESSNGLYQRQEHSFANFMAPINPHNEWLDTRELETVEQIVTRSLLRLYAPCLLAQYSKFHFANSETMMETQGLF
jgi:hypothetical protein